MSASRCFDKGLFKWALLLCGGGGGGGGVYTPTSLLAGLGLLMFSSLWGRSGYGGCVTDLFWQGVREDKLCFVLRHEARSDLRSTAAVIGKHLCGHTL